MGVHERARGLRPRSATSMVVLSTMAITGALIATPLVASASAPEGGASSITVSMTPGQEPPTITVDSATSQIQPSEVSPTTTGAVSVQVTVGDSAGLGEVNAVSMCIYEGTLAPASADDCATASTTQFEMTWTPGGGFVAATNSFGYGNNASSASSSSSSDLSSTLHFNFTASPVMNQGSDWHVVAWVIDNAEVANTESATYASPVSVDYLGWIQTPSEEGASSSDFGSIAAGGSSGDVTTPIADFLSNAPSDFTLQATGNLTDGQGDTIALVSDSPMDGQAQAQLVCGDSPSGVTTGDSSTVSTVTPSFESDSPMEEQVTCTMTYGGGATRALTSYSTTLTVGLGPTQS